MIELILLETETFKCENTVTRCLVANFIFFESETFVYLVVQYENDILQNSNIPSARVCTVVRARGPAKKMNARSINDMPINIFLVFEVS